MNANQPIDARAAAKPRADEARRPIEAVRAPRRATSRRRVRLPVPDGRVAEVMSGVARRIGERPVTFIAAAMALGFAFGGAMSFRTGRVLLSLAARQVGREMFKQLL